MCGQRSLLHDTNVQTLQVAFTRQLRTQYERIRDLRKTGCVLCVDGRPRRIVLSVTYLDVISRELG